MKAAPFTGPDVYLARNQRELTAIFKQLDADPNGKGTPRWADSMPFAGVTWTLDVGGESVWIVGLNDAEVPEIGEKILTLVHEAVHVKQGWFEALGELDPSPEFEAYTVERITAALVSQYAPSPAPRKTKARKNAA